MGKLIWGVVLLALVATLLGAEPSRIQFIFTSDVHFGITRPEFRGHHKVDARVINEALVAQANRLSEASFPKDGKAHAGQAIGPFDFMAIGGDITNRAEVINTKESIQSSAASWAQFNS